MIFNHIKISTERLQEVLSRVEITSSTNGSGSATRSTRAVTGVVSEAVLAATRDTHCLCEDEQHMSSLGVHVGYTRLHAGMPIVANGQGPGLVPGGRTGQSLGAGCTHPRWVCPRLLKVRARYGY